MFTLKNLNKKMDPPTSPLFVSSYESIPDAQPLDTIFDLPSSFDTLGASPASPIPVSTPPPSKRFRLAARSVLLTYARCTLPAGEFLEELGKLDIEEFYAVQEQHKDGTPHFHVLVEWSKKKNIKNPRKFDIKEFHPNIEATRSRAAAWKYLHKAGATYVGGDLEDPTQKKKDKDEFWRQVVDMDSKEKFLQHFKSTNPRDLILHYNNVRAFADDAFREEVEEYIPPTLQGEWQLPQPIQDWMDNNLNIEQGNNPHWAQGPLTLTLTLTLTLNPNPNPNR